MVGNAKLVDLILTHISQLKTRISFWKGVVCILKYLISFWGWLRNNLRSLHVRRFTFFIDAFLVKLQNEMRSWSTWFWHTNHDWKLEFHFEKGCLHPQVFDFVLRLTVQQSSQFTKLHEFQLLFVCCVVAWSWALLPFVMSRLAVSIFSMIGGIMYAVALIMSLQSVVSALRLPDTSWWAGSNSLRHFKH
jgi:hypothetical protein